MPQSLWFLFNFVEDFCQLNRIREDLPSTHLLPGFRDCIPDLTWIHTRDEWAVWPLDWPWKYIRLLHLAIDSLASYCLSSHSHLHHARWTHCNNNNDDAHEDERVPEVQPYRKPWIPVGLLWVRTASGRRHDGKHEGSNGTRWEAKENWKYWPNQAGPCHASLVRHHGFGRDHCNIIFLQVDISQAGVE